MQWRRALKNRDRPEMTMINEHDQDMNLRCPRLGHEIPFGYCRKETNGRPCRLILNCWWESFDVRSFLQANLPQDVMSQIEQGIVSGPPPKVASLLDIVQQAKERIGPSAANSEKPQA
jgi:hypothetical protein